LTRLRNRLRFVARDRRRGMVPLVAEEEVTGADEIAAQQK
jgi:hypothetical protein